MENELVVVQENENGSAVVQFDFNPEQMLAFTRLGIMAAIKAGLEDAKKLDPDSGVN